MRYHGLAEDCGLILCMLALFYELFSKANAYSNSLTEILGSLQKETADCETLMKVYDKTRGKAGRFLFQYNPEHCEAYKIVGPSVII